MRKRQHLNCITLWSSSLVNVNKEGKLSWCCTLWHYTKKRRRRQYCQQMYMDIRIVYSKKYEPNWKGCERAAPWSSWRRRRSFLEARLNIVDLSSSFMRPETEQTMSWKETRLISFDTIIAVGGDWEAKEILELLQTASVAGFILGSGTTLISNFRKKNSSKH